MWTDDDFEYALAWQAEQDEKCPGCGHPRSDSFDPAKAHSWTGEAAVCFACEARENKAREWNDYAAKTGDRQAGLFVGAAERVEVNDG